jgi:hypothetical protein
LDGLFSARRPKGVHFTQTNQLSEPYMTSRPEKIPCQVTSQKRKILSICKATHGENQETNFPDEHRRYKKKILNLALFLSCARSAPLFLASRGVGPRRQLRRSWVPSLTLPPLLAFSRAGARPPVHGGVHPHEPHLILEVLVQQRRPVVPRALLRLPLSLAEAAARPPAAEPEDGDGDAEQRQPEQHQREGHRQEEQRQTRRPPRRSAARGPHATR